MDSDDCKPLAAFGFLTAVEDPQHGFFGGYLVLCERGRPLEFHCSAPIFPSPAQRILYGASLRPYLLGEIIGQTLVAESKLPVQAVLTDLEEMLSLSLWRSEHVAYLDMADSSTSLPELKTEDSCGLRETTLGQYRFVGSNTCRWTGDFLHDTLAPLAVQIDLAEPFERIREAIQEAQRVTDHPDDYPHESSSAA